ncbi:hypothetical protein BS1321_22735 [Peribacillus simplex NBRC 15720 = DSM 1321]|uniref:Uncharacterized protein n=1 Tax=Peribacillus simplex NBRC 15720 = DSM 1321 TaxID=1349754 RepID=A0A223EMH6_9BACI|nr:hypothetical protein BS1321_22735 [Peribacillus simplex NBRC 15720 = DSM 1321]
MKLPGIIIPLLFVPSFLILLILAIHVKVIQTEINPRFIRSQFSGHFLKILRYSLEPIPLVISAAFHIILISYSRIKIEINNLYLKEV